MKQSRQFISMLAGALIAASAVLSADAQNVLDSDGISVVVNDTAITYDQIKDAIAPQLRALMAGYGDDEKAFNAKALELYNNEVEELIDRKLILDDFTTGGYVTNVLESVVDDQINQIIKRTYGGDRSKLMKSLQQQGMTYENFRKQQREDFIEGYMTLHNTGDKKVLISPLRIETYYNNHKDDFKVENQVKVSMIEIDQRPSDPSGMAKEVAEETLRKIDSGTPFVDMAKEISSGPHRAEGGERGWITQNEPIKELADVMFSLKPGQHSGVIQLPNGTCYLVMVEEVRPAHTSPLIEVEASIEHTLEDQERKRLRQQWIDRLKSKAHIEYYN